ncbi:MAG: gephyrin-like molybdotransferase Glp [Pseudomonadota bacterium]
MSGFDRFIMVDWSAASAPTPAKPSADAIWLGLSEPSAATSAEYYRTRSAAETRLIALCDQALATKTRLLLGFDFAFGYPEGFAKAVAGSDDPLALWDWFAAQVEDGSDNRNNRFALAERINSVFAGVGPFWARPRGLDLPGLPEKGSARHGHGLAERRHAEKQVPQAHSVWKLYTTGAVGSQVIMGLPMLARLRQRFGDAVAVWPFQPWDTAPIILTEIFPSLLADEVRKKAAAEGETIKDRAQVLLLAETLCRASQEGSLGDLLEAVPSGAPRQEEGWILGAGAEALLRAAARPDLAPPQLKNDCFAMPQGVEWTPVDVALAHLKSALGPVKRVETLPTPDCAGRVLAHDVFAARANPPGANSAVDGFGFAAAHLGPSGRQVLPLLTGRAAAGAPYRNTVAPGKALRILTGALLPAGVDTVVLEEDVAADDHAVAFEAPIKPGANTRKAGEDIAVGQQALSVGRVLKPADLALASALGVPELAVRERLRVGILSTGDELAAPGSTEDPAKTYDANRPMLLAIAERWGYVSVDLGHVRDDRAALQARLDDAAIKTDAILTSGGASAGDEDHVSALLKESGALQTWRIALKPGRPLALALWNGVPVFGLPGNPVAAFVCTLIFARPALAMIAGGHWCDPQGYLLPAAFEKRKKAGRREFLRARVTRDGAAEVFASEGSGRISGLSWADGLVELPDDAAHISPGDPVRYLPFGSFGL